MRMFFISLLCICLVGPVQAGGPLIPKVKSKVVRLYWQ